MIWLLGLLILTASCKEEEYYYPSVRLEFVTVKAGSDGKLQLLVPDRGSSLQVVEDLTQSSLGYNSSKRVMSNYEMVTLDDGSSAAKIYSLQSVVAPEPKKIDDPAFQGVIKTDPVSVTGIWIGGNYLNMILTLKVKGGKQHIFGIVEEAIEERETERIVFLSLFHNASGDEEYYDRRAYISVPLTKYHVAEVNKAIKIKFRYHTYDKDGHVIESDRYCNPGFEYVPNVD